MEFLSEKFQFSIYLNRRVSVITPSLIKSLNQLKPKFD